MFKFGYKLPPAVQGQVTESDDYLDYNQVRVISDLYKIEVFPVLEIHPSTLLLTPLMTYTI